MQNASFAQPKSSYGFWLMDDNKAVQRDGSPPQRDRDWCTAAAAFGVKRKHDVWLSKTPQMPLIRGWASVTDPIRALHTMG